MYNSHSYGFFLQILLFCTVFYFILILQLNGIASIMLYNVFIKNSKLKFGGNQLPAPMKPVGNGTKLL